jgi:hypothetical protein
VSVARPSPRNRARAAVPVAVVVAAAAGVVAAAAAAAPTPTSAARLEGSFQLAGRVTAAVNVRGERPGQVVQRVWSFRSACATGRCATVTLVRQRAHGSDTVALSRGRSGNYTGRGSFSVPLRCAGHTYRTGERVPFTITVRITAARADPTGIVAARISATYVNHSRSNLTSCVAFPAHDAARYHGYLIPAG